MKILNAHIAGFGQFTNASFEFTDGVNTILKNNGLGKTTLQAFFRVMLYGFKDETKKLKEERERELRRPWQGGAYGGTLDIEAGGRAYRIERTFGSKAAEDRLRVFDLSTRLLTDALGETPGKALFGVDSDTFERTVYVSDETIRTNVSDGVHSKLGDLVDDAVDVNRYEKADALLADALTKWSENRQTGELAKLKNQITGLEQQILSKKAVEQNLKETTEILKLRRSEDARLRAEEAEIASKQAALSEYQHAAADRAKYETLKDALSERKTELDRVAAGLPFGVPSGTELAEAEEDLLEYETKAGLASENRLTGSETDQLKDFEEEFASSSLFEGEGEKFLQLSEEVQRSEMDTKVRRKEIEKDRGNALSALRNRSVEANALFYLGIAVAVIGIVLLVIGLAGGWNPGVTLGLTLLGAGLICAGFGFFRKRRAERDEQAAEIRFAEKLKDLEKEEAYLDDSRAKLRAFFSRFGRTYQSDSSSQDLSRLMLDQSEYADLRKKKERYEAYFRDSREAAGRVQILLRKYLAPQEKSTPDLRTNLKLLSERKDLYDRSEEEYVRAKRILADFESGRDMETIRSAVKPDFPETLAELTEKVRKIREKLDGNRKDEAAYGRDEERLSERLEALTEAEEELSEAREKRTALREAVSLVTDTRTYLAAAKRSLSEKYTDPVTARFREYTAKILGESPLKFDITADGNAVIEDRGMIRKIDLLSSGYQVLTYFCMRLSLVESMYEGEKPVLFFDDPFAELDEEKLEKALALMKEAGKRYQILYVTCHPSRA
ncbi:MAG: hypothetical protein IKY02_03075 [Lachnospiraceae bacterium]|nr:hypothetical protein [Lachnospiraceae bacterium]